MWMQLKIKTTNESAVCRLHGFSLQIKNAIGIENKYRNL